MHGLQRCSVTVMTNAELVEFVWGGLANSISHDLLWNVDHLAGPHQRRAASSGVPGGDQRVRPAGQLVPTRRGAASRDGERVSPDALWMEFDAGEPLRRGANAVLVAFLCGAADRSTAGTSARSGAWAWRSAMACGGTPWKIGEDTEGYRRAGRKERRCVGGRWSGGTPPCARARHSPTGTRTLTWRSWRVGDRRWWTPLWVVIGYS
jgi:hypothetical protein